MIFITHRNQIRLDSCTIAAKSTMEDKLITSYWQVLIWPTGYWESWKGSDKKKLNSLLVSEKIYFKIFVTDEHRNLLRILWWRDGNMSKFAKKNCPKRYIQVTTWIWCCFFKRMQQLCANRNSCCEWKWISCRYQQGLWKKSLYVVDLLKLKMLDLI